MTTGSTYSGSLMNIVSPVSPELIGSSCTGSLVGLDFGSLGIYYFGS
jgi:hypothetical protein